MTESDPRRPLQRLERGPGWIDGRTNLFFGRLSSDEWDCLSYKHLDHHLRQFGR